MYRSTVAIGLLTLLACGNAEAEAALHPYLTDEVVVYAGGFFSKLKFNVTVDSTIGSENGSIDSWRGSTTLGYRGAFAYLTAHW